MQDSGLKDKRGNLIINNDILKYKDKLGIVRFFDGAFWFVLEDDYELLVRVNDKSEVMGNCNSHKELARVITW